MTDCLTKSGDEACKCWNGLDDLRDQFKNNCNADEVKAERNLFKRDKEACVTQFQKCKKMEDDSVSVAAACSTGRQALYNAYTKAVSRVSSALTGAYNKIKEIYFNHPDVDESAPPIRIGWSARTVLWVGMLGMLAMGIYMGPFYTWAKAAAESLVPLGMTP